ncbi:hydroxyacid dehydrogenase [Pseudoflavonifractor phocaeensis]|uniref:hydroxyacid dehydrogenase n=1 Tax=Pseudoflavonifractor phocaeensis TaxID=1870988 RepID=UPI001F19825B|nr:hydroxyacid dehydrogenase [Pseudoflavonifractor phocaeensis]MCF2660556.1 hydroxyacid dehydrogenase [Pseudoflavonifractor phocaeensis]
MKFVLTHSLSQAGMDVLHASGAELFVANSAEPATYLDQLKDADGFIIRVGLCPASIIDQCPNLKVIGRTGVGYDNVDVAHATSLGIPVVFTPGANNRSVAEHAVASMFALAKNMKEADEELRQGNWKIRDAKKAFELYGKKVGIIGVGAIGKYVAEICQGVGMKTAGFSHSKNRAKVEAAGCEYYEDMDQLLRDCDIITIHNPLTPETKNMISAPQLAMMKKTALLINTSRGPIVNEQDLADALNNDVIAGAAVDVYSVEPAELSNPVFNAKNLIVTPHSAALTREGTDRMGAWCAEGCVAICNGQRWENVVDKSVYNHEKFAK